MASHPKYMNFNNTSFEACYFLQRYTVEFMRMFESLTSRELDFPPNVIDDIRSGGSRGHEGRASLSQSNFLIFKQFSTKIMANDRLVPLLRLAPPALGNPGSASDSPPSRSLHSSLCPQAF